jgi:N-acetylmuramoyl-L-alanine amidase
MIEVWDPGHGGADPGAVDGVNPAEGDQLVTEEDDVALAVCLAVRDLRTVAGRRVMLTRDTERTVSLDERAQLANRAGAALFVSIHLNSAANTEACGIETWYHAQSPRGMRLATCLYGALVEAMPELPAVARRGVRSDTTRYRSGFAVLRETIAPAALVELGFLSNPGDERQANDPAWVARVAGALARGVDDYLVGGGGEVA